MRASSGMIGANRVADLRVLHQVLEQPDERHRGSDGLLARAAAQLVVDRVRRQRERPGPDYPLGQVAAERGAALAHVLDLVGLLARVVVRRQLGLQRGVGDLQVEPVAELLELGHGQLLHLVGRVAGLEVGAERPALDRVGQDHGRLADVLGRRLERGVDLAVVVPAAGQVADLVVGRGARPWPAGAGRRRRSSPWCRRRTRPRRSGTGRPGSCSSC